MLEFIEKWALQRLLKKYVDKIKAPKLWIAEIWEAKKDIILEKITKSIEKIIKDVIEKSLEGK